MGDSLREAAFDAAYGILGDVGEAEDCATEALAHAERRRDTVGSVPDPEAWVVREASHVAMARIRRGRRRLATLGAVAAVLFVAAAGVAAARSGGGAGGTVQTAAVVPTIATGEPPPTTEAVTTTTVVLMQPPLETVPEPSTTPTAPAVRHPSPTTAATTAAPPTNSAAPNATLAVVSPPKRDPKRVYVAARGSDADSYVSRMTIDWGDGSPAMSFDYPLSSCHDMPSNQAADTNHGYAAPGRYTVRLIVTSVGCDGTGAQTATAETIVTSPSSAP